MKRKLTIAAGIIHEPKILFLDEPTTGIEVARKRRSGCATELLSSSAAGSSASARWRS